MEAKTYTGKVVFAIVMLFIFVKLILPAMQTAATNYANQYMNNVYSQVSQSFDVSQYQ
jgi:hypothetical protein